MRRTRSRTSSGRESERCGVRRPAVVAAVAAHGGRFGPTRDYFFAESKPETLLLAALDYSLEKLVVYAAPKPPRSVFRTIAGRLGRKIVYVPLGTLNKATLKKLRTMHVLDGHEKRETARDYIW